MSRQNTTYRNDVCRACKVLCLTLLCCVQSIYADSLQAVLPHSKKVIDSTYRQALHHIVIPANKSYESSPEAEKVVQNILKQRNGLSNYLWQRCKYQTYSKLMGAWDNFSANKRWSHRWKFVAEAADTSLTSGRSVLPMALFESVETHYRQQHPSAHSRVVEARHTQGVTDDLDAVKMCEDIVEMMEQVDVHNNTFRLFVGKLVSPLHSSKATRLYRWYITDTVQIDGEPHQVLSFRPASLMEWGMVGNLYVTMDGTFAVRRSVMRISQSSVVNFLDEFSIQKDYRQVAFNVWMPHQLSMVAKTTFLGMLKGYFELSRDYKKYVFGNWSSQKERLSGRTFLPRFDEQSDEFWQQHRTQPFTQRGQEYQIDSLEKKLRSLPLLRLTQVGIDVLKTSYFPTTQNPHHSKINIGTLQTFYSRNSIEGNRLRLSFVTTSKLHPRLFFEGYGGYGFEDRRWKYSLKTIWAFNCPITPHSYPQHHLSFTLEDDLNILGENSLYFRKQSILSALLRKRNLDRMTYARRYEIAYMREWENGMYLRMLAKSQNERPAGNLTFEMPRLAANADLVKHLQTTELSTILRYSNNERFWLGSQQRIHLPNERFVASLTYSLGLKDVLGGQYGYHRVQLHLIKELWLAGFGQINASLKAEKVWGRLPYPLLLSPNANNSYTVQNESYSLLRALEFINDRQFCWDIDYSLRGWLFRRIPLVKRWRLREHLGVAGFWGDLSAHNHPDNNLRLFAFPHGSGVMHGTPYVEVSAGVSNIFRFLRFEYVRRLTYLSNPEVKKDGFRISFRLRL